MLAVITYMDTVRGVFYPEGGMHAVPRGMAQALTDAGVPVHLGVDVSEILRRSDGAVRSYRVVHTPPGGEPRTYEFAPFR